MQSTTNPKEPYSMNIGKEIDTRTVTPAKIDRPAEQPVRRRIPATKPVKADPATTPVKTPSR
jgi:hypothetical protein